MTRYLLAAEADKIQDLLFRSSRLREVVGGSKLLTRFCKEVPGLLGAMEGDIIVNDGGGFRILFDTEKAARDFGEQLAEMYRLATGGTLTLAEPVPVNGDFGTAHREAHENLRRAKRWRTSWQTPAHLPYVAFCASCGVGLAVSHLSIHPEEDAQYVCQSCLAKGIEGRSRRNPKAPAQKRMGEFLSEFYQVVAERKGLSLEQLHWPGETVNPRIGEVDPLEDVAEYDPRHYVAYIVADGNNMGQVFSACHTEGELRDLSNGLTDAIHRALAASTDLLMDQPRPRIFSDKENLVPVNPLILGGDDVFVLLPAPWALDFARRFAEAYKDEMKKVTRGLKDVPDPTISVAVVICKSKHPYALAHEIGERLLKQAKQMSKRWAWENNGQPASTVNFEVVLGGRLTEPSEAGSFRSTLRPYWAGVQSNKWGLSIQELINQRYGLRDVPRKRLAELRDLYDLTNLPSSLRDEHIKPWMDRLEWILQRMERYEKKEQPGNTSGGKMREALNALGGGEKGYWRRVSRLAEDSWHGHGLPDLLRVWDFALDLSKDRSEYEEG